LIEITPQAPSTRNYRPDVTACLADRDCFITLQVLLLYFTSSNEVNARFADLQSFER